MGYPMEPRVVLKAEAKAQAQEDVGLGVDVSVCHTFLIGHNNKLDIYLAKLLPVRAIIKTRALEANQEFGRDSDQIAGPSHSNKRKAEAPPASQPKPLSKRAKDAESATREIVARPYDELTKLSEQAIWLRAALDNFGATDFDGDTSVADLPSRTPSRTASHTAS
ncbi:hypothetical protein FRC06_000578 [Ceratobasidium sp. 370]|nr:hypothetical protein FRC06_000578 [Ceratobasidium sp. 370]